MKLAITIGAMLVPTTALAHPNHWSDGGQGLTHLFTDPYHLAMMVGAVVLFVLLRRTLLRRRSANRRIG